MSEFAFKGNVSAINQQIGDNNTMTINGQHIDVNWNRLQQEIKQLERECVDKKDKKLLKEFSTVLTDEKPQRLRMFLKRNINEFTKDILSGITASAVWELIKILL